MRQQNEAISFTLSAQSYFAGVISGEDWATHQVDRYFEEQLLLASVLLKIESIQRAEALDSAEPKSRSQTIAYPPTTHHRISRSVHAHPAML
jgi:hypothetical protein